MNSSKNIDHGNYIPSPILPGMKVADGEHIRKVFVLSADDVAAGAEVAERVEATVGSTGSPTTKVTEIPSNIEVGADAALDLTANLDTLESLGVYLVAAGRLQKNRVDIIEYQVSSLSDVPSAAAMDWDRLKSTVTPLDAIAYGM